MNRARLQAGKAKLVQPYADRVDMNLNRKSPLHFRLKVHASPANDAMAFRLGSDKNKVEQLGICVNNGARPGLRRDFKPLTPHAL